MTWTEEIVWLIQNHTNMEDADKIRLDQRIPFVDIKRSPEEDSRVKALQSAPHPWLIKSHFPARVFQSQIDAGQCKFIIILRNIKDVLLSYYHFYKANYTFGFFTGSFEDFFELFRNKRLCYGDWLDHSLGWWKYRNHKNVLILTYESMKKDINTEIKKICLFCDKFLTSDEIDFIVKRTDFNTMKNNPMSNYVLSLPSSFYDSSISPFIRKGEVGGWKTYFNDEMSAFVDEHYINKAGEEGLQFDWTL